MYVMVNMGPDAVLYVCNDEHGAWCSLDICNAEHEAWCSLLCQNCSLGRTDEKCWEVVLGQNPIRIQREQE